MPRYVLLWHACPATYRDGPHWDLMFEQGEGLATWSALEFPFSGGEVQAQRLADHRLAYLALEGDIGGGRGTVTRRAAGEFVGDLDPLGCCLLNMSTGELQGELTLTPSDSDHWSLRFHPSLPLGPGLRPGDL